MVNLRHVATKFPEISAYDVLGLLVYNCGIESVEMALNEIKSAQQTLVADGACQHANTVGRDYDIQCVDCGGINPHRRR